jgi:hypothetical protein
MCNWATLFPGKYIKEPAPPGWGVPKTQTIKYVHDLRMAALAMPSKN